MHTIIALWCWIFDQAEVDCSGIYGYQIRALYIIVNWVCINPMWKMLQDRRTTIDYIDSFFLWILIYNLYRRISWNKYNKEINILNNVSKFTYSIWNRTVLLRRIHFCKLRGEWWSLKDNWLFTWEGIGTAKTKQTKCRMGPSGSAPVCCEQQAGPFW